MSELAAHLVDRVIPDVPVRQWVLSLPWSLRYQVAFDAKLCGAVLGVFRGAAAGKTSVTGSGLGRPGVQRVFGRLIVEGGRRGRAEVRSGRLRQGV